VRLIGGGAGRGVGRPARGWPRRRSRPGPRDNLLPRGPYIVQVQKSLTVAAAVTVALVIGGCSPAARHHPARLAVRPVTSIAEHWGALFGGGKGYFGRAATPAAVTLPGTVAKVGSSNSTEYALLTNGALYAWGLGTQGQLGDGGDQNSFGTPVRVRFPAGVKIASIPTDVMPFDTGLAVDTRGRAWGWGDNGGGELCLGNKRQYRTPVELPFSRVTALAGASNHTVFDSGGILYSCGQNLAGSLGDGQTSPSTTPRRVAGLDGSSVVSLVAAFANSGALLSNGEYYDWGLNTAGQLGDGKHKESDVPVRVSLPGPVTQAAQGGSYWPNGQSLVLLSDGSVWAWGDGTRGQLGDGVARSRRSPGRVHVPAGVRFASLATGGATSYAISTTGNVYAWGASYLGQIGNGKTRTERNPVLVTPGATAVSATAGNVVVNVPGKRHVPSGA
jgi:alpha-tubulin suppressor-like RCC1 family protein